MDGVSLIMFGVGLVAGAGGVCLWCLVALGRPAKGSKFKFKVPPPNLYPGAEVHTRSKLRVWKDARGMLRVDVEGVKRL